MSTKRIDWLGLLEQGPAPGLGNGGLGRLAACFLDSMARMQLPAMGYGLRYEYGIFRQTIEDGWRREQPDNWLRRPDPWEWLGRRSRWRSSSAARSVRGGGLGVIVGRPSILLGQPFDRPVVGYGGATIDTLCLWAAAAPDVFDFQVFSAGEFVSALAERSARSLTRVLYPDDSTGMGRGCASCRSIFSLPCSLAAWSGASAGAMPIGHAVDKVAKFSSTTPIPAGRARADADSARRGASRMGRRVGP